MMVSVTAVALGAEGPVRYVGTITELGQQRWIEAESSRRAAELSALSALAVATGSSVEPATMLRAAARQIVEGLEVDACWIHRYEAADGGHLALAGEASYLHPTLRLSPRMIPDAINPGVLRAIETREQVVTSELLERSIATVVHAPLLAANEVVGVVSILSVEGEKLTTRNRNSAGRHLPARHRGQNVRLSTRSQSTRRSGGRTGTGTAGGGAPRGRPPEGEFLAKRRDSGAAQLHHRLPESRPRRTCDTDEAQEIWGTRSRRDASPGAYQRRPRSRAHRRALQIDCRGSITDPRRRRGDHGSAGASSTSTSRCHAPPGLRVLGTGAFVGCW
jgi:hypothetical protein